VLFATGGCLLGALQPVEAVLGDGLVGKLLCPTRWVSTASELSIHGITAPTAGHQVKITYTERQD
jgi:hypothetical protein